MICLVRLIVAAVCGLLIGVERQTRMKGAGSRTHMMVSLGAALMTLVSSYGFLPIVGAAGVSVDVSRVAASIAAGIGFLGAGVIFVHRVPDHLLCSQCIPENHYGHCRRQCGV